MAKIMSDEDNWEQFYSDCADRHYEKSGESYFIDAGVLRPDNANSHLTVGIYVGKQLSEKPITIDVCIHLINYDLGVDVLHAFTELVAFKEKRPDLRCADNLGLQSDVVGLQYRVLIRDEEELQRAMGYFYPTWTAVRNPPADSPEKERIFRERPGHL